MPRAKPKPLILGLYIPVLIVGLLWPRNALSDSEPMNLIKRILHEILFLTGPPEVFLNFLIFIPFYFALSYLVSRLSRHQAAIVSCLTSAAAELAQSQIPGRVSSWRDFFSNCLGVLVAAVILCASSRKRTV
jgi:glycopeptide antibiotics resistance protein